VSYPAATGAVDEAASSSTNPAEHPDAAAAATYQFRMEIHPKQLTSGRINSVKVHQVMIGVVESDGRANGSALLDIPATRLEHVLEYPLYTLKDYTAT
jgi:hypothetical protein